MNVERVASTRRVAERQRRRSVNRILRRVVTGPSWFIHFLSPNSFWRFRSRVVSCAESSGTFTRSGFAFVSAKIGPRAPERVANRAPLRDNIDVASQRRRPTRSTAAVATLGPYA